MRCPACGSDTGTDLTDCARCGALLQAAPLVPDSWFVQPKPPPPADDPTLVEHRFADIPPAGAAPFGPPPAPPPPPGPPGRRPPGYLGWVIAGGFALALAAVLIVLWPAGGPERGEATNTNTGTSAPPSPAETSASAVPTERFFVDTFAAAPGYAGPATAGGPVGRLEKGTHYVFCKRQGQRMSRKGGAATNHWWLLTNLDRVYAGGSPRAWVPALYLAHWGDDEAKDNSGRDIPDCPR
ncbi:hypothetical protein [Actinomadura sp. 21ATH]|uniref:hypothetical protein n=1 Tax=Actinomadura sp. 21ATH TaxID=1735444 RepID=UPI0035BF710F